MHSGYGSKSLILNLTRPTDDFSLAFVKRYLNRPVNCDDRHVTLKHVWKLRIPHSVT